MPRHHPKPRPGPWSKWDWSEQRGSFVSTRDNGRGGTEYQYGQRRGQVEAQQAQQAQQPPENPRYTEHSDFPVPAPVSASASASASAPNKENKEYEEEGEEYEEEGVEYEYEEEDGAGQSTAANTGYTYQAQLPAPSYTTAPNRAAPAASWPYGGTSSSLYQSSMGYNQPAAASGFDAPPRDFSTVPSGNRSNISDPNSEERFDPGSMDGQLLGDVNQGIRDVSLASPPTRTRRDSQAQNDEPSAPTNYQPDKEKYKQEAEGSRPTGNKPRQERFITTKNPELNEEPLKKSFCKHKSSKFKKGAVFKILWTEPLGEDNETNQTEVDDDQTAISRVIDHEGRVIPAKHGEKAFTEIRRFIVTKERSGHCLCVPISSYGLRGTTKPGVKPKYHAIIHTTPKAPKELDGESKLRNKPIKMVYSSKKEGTLHPSSRINYSKIYTIEHNVKVLFIGQIDKGSMEIFKAGVKMGMDLDDEETSN